MINNSQPFTLINIICDIVLYNSAYNRINMYTQIVIIYAIITHILIFNIKSCEWKFSIGIQRLFTGDGEKRAKLGVVVDGVEMQLIKLDKK